MLRTIAGFCCSRRCEWGRAGDKFDVCVGCAIVHFVGWFWLGAICGVFAVLFTSFCCFSQIRHNAAVDAPPRISINTRVVNLGTLGPGATKTCRLHFMNKGGNPLLIDSVQSTCGCAAVPLEKKTFSPGESGVIDVHYIQSMGTAGTARKTVHIHSNDPVDPITSVTLQARIARPDHGRGVVGRPPHNGAKS